MQSLFLLTGPNGGGKSSILRSICATALLGICGLMVPAEKATIPHFDSIMLHMLSYDSPADGKSSFQMEMSEMRSILLEATNRSLVLVDEICRGTEVQKGTCIAASMIEELDSIGCFGVISTHLHGLLDLPLRAKFLVYKAMGSQEVNGKIKPTWQLIDGVCRESLAFETALSEGIPENVVRRAGELYASLKQDNVQELGKGKGSVKMNTASFENIRYPGNDDETKCKYTTVTEKVNYANNYFTDFSEIEQSIALVEDCDRKLLEYSRNGSYHKVNVNSDGGWKREGISDPHYERTERTAIENMTTSGTDIMISECNLRLLKDAEKAFISACEEKLQELYGPKPLPPRSSRICCSFIGAHERPPPTLVKCSCVYMLQRPDGRFYVGQTDDLAGRISTHRSQDGWKNVPFLYIKVAGKSVAREFETFAINKLSLQGIELVNIGDKNHRNFGTSFTSDILPF